MDPNHRNIKETVLIRQKVALKACVRLINLITQYEAYAPPSDERNDLLGEINDAAETVGGETYWMMSAIKDQIENDFNYRQKGVPPRAVDHTPSIVVQDDSVVS